MCIRDSRTAPPNVCAHSRHTGIAFRRRNARRLPMCQHSRGGPGTSRSHVSQRIWMYIRTDTTYTMVPATATIPSQHRNHSAIPQANPANANCRRVFADGAHAPLLSLWWGFAQASIHITSLSSFIVEHNEQRHCRSHSFRYRLSLCHSRVFVPLCTM